jgi:LytS/YehU family sensor histidine kinase
MIKKIWIHPVWSNVISAVIITIAGFLITIIYSELTSLTIKQSSKFLWYYEIELGTAITATIIIFLLLATIQKIIEKSPTKGEKLKAKFRKEFRKFDNNTEHTTIRFNSNIDSVSNYPYIKNLRVYCTAHDGEENLMDNYNGCPDHKCVNYKKNYDKNYLTNHIETYLLKQWENMIK